MGIPHSCHATGVLPLEQPPPHMYLGVKITALYIVWIYLQATTLKSPHQVIKYVMKSHPIPWQHPPIICIENYEILDNIYSEDFLRNLSPTYPCKKLPHHHSTTTEISLCTATTTNYSYHQLASMYWWHSHSRTVVFHTLHRGQRDTRLCPLIS